MAQALTAARRGLWLWLWIHCCCWQELLLLRSQNFWAQEPVLTVTVTVWRPVKKGEGGSRNICDVQEKNMVEWLLVMNFSIGPESRWCRWLGSGSPLWFLRSIFYDHIRDFTIRTLCSSQRDESFLLLFVAEDLYSLCSRFSNIEH